jgi:ABC-type sugar transport system substrate-binding protein
MKKAFTIVSMLAILSIMIVACTPAATPTAAPAAPAATSAPQIIKETVVVQQTVEVAAPTKASSGQALIGYAGPSLTGGQGAIMAGMVDGAKAQGWQVVTTSANEDAPTQANQINSFISEGVKAIVAVPVDSKAICASIAQATAAGIPFFTIDRAPEGCAVTMTVQSDNYLGGQQAGQSLIKMLQARYNGKAQGTVLELQGDLSQNVAQLRGAGFDDVMKQYPDVKVIQKPTNWDATKFASDTQDVASSTPLDAIYMHSDCVGYKPVTATLQQLNKLVKNTDPKHIFLVGVDGCHDTLQGIRDGFADESSSQPLPDDGVVIAGYIAQTLANTPITEGTVTKAGALWSPATIKKTDTGFVCNLSTTAVTKDNVDNAALWGNE